jgi:hypothetical protein
MCGWRAWWDFLVGGFQPGAELMPRGGARAEGRCLALPLLAPRPGAVQLLLHMLPRCCLYSRVHS